MRNKIKYIPLLVLIIVLSMTIGYSAFNSSLLVSDVSATIRAETDIRVTDIRVSNSTGGAVSNSEDYNVQDLLLDFNLPENASITYEVEVTNFGNTKMEILDVLGLPNNLTYTINGYTLDEPLCDDNNTSQCTLGSVTTFTITISYAPNGYNSSNTNYNFAVGLDFEIYDYYDLTIVSDQNDSSLTLITTEGTFTGTGTVTHRVKEGETVRYTASKTLYVTVDETYTMPGEDHTINIHMSLLTYRITFDPNGGSVSPGYKDVIYNTAIGQLPTPTKPNAIFIGWFADVPSQRDSTISYRTDPLLYYADAYGDLYNAFGYDDNSLYSHYLNNGYGEGRRISQYLATDVLSSNTDITLYAGWVYKWEKFDKKIVFDEQLVATGAQSGGIAANSYFTYHERAKLNEIANISDQQLHFTQGMKSSISNKLPDHDVYVFAANSDSIKTLSWTTSGNPGMVVDHYCVITGSRVTLVAYITCDIYKVSNIRYGKGNNSSGYIYNTNSSAFPNDGESGNNWYVIQ